MLTERRRVVPAPAPAPAPAGGDAAAQNTEVAVLAERGRLVNIVLGGCQEILARARDGYHAADAELMETKLIEFVNDPAIQTRDQLYAAFGRAGNIPPFPSQEEYAERNLENRNSNRNRNNNNIEDDMLDDIGLGETDISMNMGAQRQEDDESDDEDDPMLAIDVD